MTKDMQRLMKNTFNADGSVKSLAGADGTIRALATNTSADAMNAANLRNVGVGIGIGKFQRNPGGKATMVVRDVNNMPPLLAAMPAIMKETAQDAAEEIHDLAVQIWAERGVHPDVEEGAVTGGRPTPWTLEESTVRKKGGIDRPLFHTGQVIDALEAGVIKMDDDSWTALVGFKDEIYNPPNNREDTQKITEIMKRLEEGVPGEFGGFKWMARVSSAMEDAVMDEAVRELLGKIQTFNSIKRTGRFANAPSTVVRF